MVTITSIPMCPIGLIALSRTLAKMTEGVRCFQPQLVGIDLDHNFTVDEGNHCVVLFYYQIIEY